jgi:hypothetical protein
MQQWADYLDELKRHAGQHRAASNAVPFGFKPFQQLLNLGYTILDDVCPIFGCSSCGVERAWVKPITRFIAWIKSRSAKTAARVATPHFSRAAPPVRKPAARS